MREEKRRELGRPLRFLMCWIVRETLTQEIRIVSHEGGNPETEVSRTLNVAEAAWEGESGRRTDEKKGSRWSPGSRINP